MQISHATRQGGREYQEDVVGVLKLKDGRTLIWVCDGHGGARCAQYITRFLQAHGEKHLSKKHREDLMGLVVNANAAWTQECLKALGVSRPPGDAEERRVLFEVTATAKVREAYERKGLESGSTIALLLVDPVQCRAYWTHVGDSRVVCKPLGQGHLRATQDHKPNRKDLGPAGGSITRSKNDVPRINSDIAVGRALGDNTSTLWSSLRQDPHEQLEVSWPRAWTIRFVVGSDGIFDVLSNEEVIGEAQPQLTAAMVLDFVERRAVAAELDNLSAVVVTLSPATTKPRRKPTTRRARRGTA